MELGLNLLWLLLAMASVAIWRRQRSRSLRRQQLLGWRGLIAIGCVLVLLFPVISITDDLHAEQAMIEDSNPVKRTLRGWGTSHASSNLGKLSHPALRSIPSPSSSKFNLILGYVNPTRSELARSLALTPVASRGPPPVQH